jgi:hypothetical protein
MIKLHEIFHKMSHYFLEELNRYYSELLVGLLEYVSMHINKKVSECNHYQEECMKKIIFRIT